MARRHGWFSYGPRPAAYGAGHSVLSVAATAASDQEEDFDRLRPSDFRKLGRRAVRGVAKAARAEDRVTFGKLLAEHLQVDTGQLEVVEESWPLYDHVNVQVGVDSWLGRAGREHRLVGVTNFHHFQFGLTDLLHASGAGAMHLPVPGNVAMVQLPTGPDGQVQACVRCAVYLVDEDGRRSALLLRGGDPEEGHGSVSLQAVAAGAGDAQRIAGAIRELALAHNVYRGQVVSFGRDMFGERGAALRFHHRPAMTREQLVLPDETMAAVERQVVGVAAQRDRLLQAGQHLKRGLLLYGPPGVGKTHTVRYLISRLAGTTVVELSGEALRLIETACSIARSLQPAMVVVEDVDLIAEERDRFGGQHPLLFQLLNQMDGLAEDADVVFVLTTNRADLLERALASRPGRVDQAVEIALPSAADRRRLFELYRGGLAVEEARLDSVIDRTEGVTASFLKELLRRAAVLSAASDPSADGAPITVSADLLDEALDELLDTRNAMTRVLLGGKGQE